MEIFLFLKLITALAAASEDAAIFLTAVHRPLKCLSKCGKIETAIGIRGDNK